MNKLQKHIKILEYKYKTSCSINSLIEFNNITVNQIIKSFNKVKNNDFYSSDFSQFNLLESNRDELKKSRKVITYEVFNSDLKREVQEIAKKSASPKVWCTFYYSLIQELKVNKYLEIGTNLGISGSYIISALNQQQNSHFITLEGVPALCRIANNTFNRINTNTKVEVIEGLYDYTFPELLKKDIKFDMIFIDGNHKKEPTLKYFNTLKNKINSSAVFLFDDINWNDEMRETWQIIIKDSKVNYSIDLYKLGIIVIDPLDDNFNINKQMFLSY